MKIFARDNDIACKTIGRRFESMKLKSTNEWSYTAENEGRGRQITI